MHNNPFSFSASQLHNAAINRFEYRSIFCSTLYGVLLIPQILLMADAHASTVFPLHTQNPEVIPTAKTMKCLSISTEKSGEVGWGGQLGQSKDLSQLNNAKIQQQQK